MDGLCTHIHGGSCPMFNGRSTAERCRQTDRNSNIRRSASVRCNPQAAWLREFFRQQRRKEAQVAQKRNEMMPALSPVNTLEHMAEHPTFANFLCENTQNTWNTYFCEKTGERLQYRTTTRSEPRGLYTRTHVLCVPCVPARPPMSAICVAGWCTCEKSGEHFQSRHPQSKRGVNPLAPARATLFWVPETLFHCAGICLGELSSRQALSRSVDDRAS